MADNAKSAVYEPIPIVNGSQISMIITATLCIAIPTFLVALRLLARRKIRVPWNASDFLIVASLLFMIGLCIADLFMVFRGGYGFRTSDVVTRFGPDALVTFFKCQASWPILWNCCIWTSKVSILLMYKSVFPQRSMTNAIYAIAIFLTLYNIGGILGAALICRPYAKNYYVDVDGECGDVKLFYIWLSALNLVSDLVIMILPIPYLLKLQLALPKKIVLIAMFSIGFITCAVTIYRQSSLPSLDATNPTGSGLAFLLSTVEVGVAVSMACVPYLRPLFRSMFPGSSNRPSDYDISKTPKVTKRSRTTDGFNELADDEVELHPVKGGIGEEGIRVQVETQVQREPSSKESNAAQGGYYQYHAEVSGRN